MSVVTQAMGARYEARTVFKLVTQIAGDKSCMKLSSLNRFHLEFAVFVTIVRSAIGETSDKISHRARHRRYSMLHLNFEWMKQKLDREVTEVLR
jgi:hypothetical protein